MWLIDRFARLFTLLFLIGALSATATARVSNPEPAAEAAAAKWLALVDAGKYNQSWIQAASYVRQTVAQAAWSSSVAAARAQCGPLQARRLASAYVTSYLPDSPDGHYVVIHYSSQFARKKKVVETLTMVEQSPNQWRVIGYYIN